MYKPDKNTQELKDLIDQEFRVKGYIRWPFVQKFLKGIYNAGFYHGVKSLEKEYQEQLKACRNGRHGDTESGGFGKPDICQICGEDV